MRLACDRLAERVHGIESFVQPVNEMGEGEEVLKFESSKVRELEEKREAVDNGNKRSTLNVQLSTLKWRGAETPNAQRPTSNAEVYFYARLWTLNVAQLGR